MTEMNELERQIADLKKQLEATKSAQAAPGFHGSFSMIGELWGMIPRPLKLAVAAVFVAWLGLEVYITAQSQMLDLEVKSTRTVPLVIK